MLGARPHRLCRSDQIRGAPHCLCEDQIQGCAVPPANHACRLERPSLCPRSFLLDMYLTTPPPPPPPALHRAIDVLCLAFKHYN